MRKEILIIGETGKGSHINEAFSRKGLGASLVGCGAPVTTCVTELEDLNGSFDDYIFSIRRPDGPVQTEGSGAIIYQGQAYEPNFEDLGLKKGDYVISLSDLEKDPDHYQPAVDGRGQKPLVVFLLGVAGESSAINTRRVLNHIPRFLDRLGWRVVVLYGNLKVSGHGLEALYREARKKGAVFLRTTSSRPVFAQDDAGKVRMEFEDEATAIPLAVQAELTVVDEHIRPALNNPSIHQMLGSGDAPDGFLPTDNVHRMGLETRRRGILSLSPEGDPLGRDSIEDDINALMLHVRSLERIDQWATGKTAKIDPRLCARCLTCFRSCPYGAVFLNDRVEISPEACFGCGICEAGCPARAIALSGPSETSTAEDAKAREEIPTANPGSVVIYGCRRGAEKAMALCRHLGEEIPGEVAFKAVDCAGRISTEMLLEPFLRDAPGVLVLACHSGNCHADKGTQVARSRVDTVRKTLDQIGIGGDRVGFYTLAANTGAAFGRVVKDFVERIHE